jgi:hypothetical protein
MAERSVLDDDGSDGSAPPVSPGATRSSAAKTVVQKAAGSLSPSSRDTHDEAGTRYEIRASRWHGELGLQ